MLQAGIVGLPNVGKSTLFRALTSVAVPAENYPFCTIDPNVGVVEVPDDRLDRLQAILERETVEPAVVEFVDIAGLVEGASRGEGLGNRFLENIREVDAIAHVVRCFGDETVARAGGSSGPIDDLEVVLLELALADLARVEERLELVDKRSRLGGEDVERELSLLRRLRDRLEAGEPARSEAVDEEERTLLKDLQLLTARPVLYVANVDAERLEGPSPDLDRVREWVDRNDPGAEVVPISARLEAELRDFPPEERREMLEAHGLVRSGLRRVVQAGFRALGLQTFFTWNEEELRAWTLRRGARAPEAAGRIHSDFEKHFIRAETIAWDRFVELGSMREARNRGSVRSEGKDYEVQDGDILLIRHSA